MRKKPTPMLANILPKTSEIENEAANVFAAGLSNG